MVVPGHFFTVASANQMAGFAAGNMTRKRVPRPCFVVRPYYNSGVVSLQFGIGLITLNKV